LSLSLNKEYMTRVRKSCQPGVWSEAMAMSKSYEIIVDSSSDEEIIFRIRLPHHVLSPKVSLWPSEDDWFCDCKSSKDPCPHVAACVIFASEKKTVAKKTKPEQVAVLSYRFTTVESKLYFDRYIIGIKETRLPDSLISFVGGIDSGRIKHFPVSATKADFAVDMALGPTKRGILDRPTLFQVIKVLDGFPNVLLDGKNS